MRSMQCSSYFRANIHHELVRLTKELKDSETSDVAMEAVENVLGDKAKCISYYLGSVKIIAQNYLQAPAE